MSDTPEARARRFYCGVGGAAAPVIAGIAALVGAVEHYKNMATKAYQHVHGQPCLACDKGHAAVRALAALDDTGRKGDG